MNRFVLVKLLVTFLSSCSQIMLKISANKEHKSKIFEILNPLVIISYGIFFLCVFMSVYSLKGISLALSAVIESLGFILIPAFSYLFLKEKISRSQLFGILLIVIGMIVYNL